MKLPTINSKVLILYSCSAITDDQLWISAYLLDAARQLPVVGQSALLTDLISPSGQSVLHQWLAVTDGRAASSFRLADSLQTGQYRLRASTSLDPSVDNPAFECSLPIYTIKLDGPVAASANLSAPSVKTVRLVTARDSMDAQFLPEGGRWLAGVSSRLGIKVVTHDGREQAIHGRMVFMALGEPTE